VARACPFFPDAALIHGELQAAPRSAPWYARLDAWVRWRAAPRAYGTVWSFKQDFYTTVPVPFAVVELPGGVRPAVIFARWSRSDVFAPFSRVAADRIASAGGWSFPRDLRVPELADAIWDFIWAASPAPRLRVPFHEVCAQALQGPVPAAGEVAATADWAPFRDDPRPDRIRLVWDEHRLEIVSERDPSHQSRGA